MNNTIRLPYNSEVFGRNQKRIFKIFGKVTGNSEYSSQITGSDWVWALQPTTNPYPCMNCVDGNGNKIEHHQFYPYVGIRPCMEYSDMGDKAHTIYDFGDGLKLVKYGMYPKRKCTPEEVSALMKLQNENLAQRTGSFYYRRSSSIEMTKTRDGESIVTFKDPYFTSGYDLDTEFVDIYGNKYAYCHGTWYLVEPILWLVDEVENYAITEEIISGGIPVGKCFDKNTTTKIRSELLSIILFVDRVIKYEINDTITSHIRFPEVEDCPSQVFEETKILDGLTNRMTSEQLTYLEEMITFYQDKKDNYSPSSYVRRGR